MTFENGRTPSSRSAGVTRYQSTFSPTDTVRGNGNVKRSTCSMVLCPVYHASGSSPVYFAWVKRLRPASTSVDERAPMRRLHVGGRAQATDSSRSLMNDPLMRK